MGKFIDEVAKVNQNNNYRLKLSEEKENVRNSLYRRIYKEFNKNFNIFGSYDNIDIAYRNLMLKDKKNFICYKEFDFGNHVSMEFIETTYYKELEKVYKIFKKYQKITNEISNIADDVEEKRTTKSLMLVIDEKGRMKQKETYDKHVKTHEPFTTDFYGKHKIEHYKIYDRDKKPYDFKVYYNKENKIDIDATTKELKKDGLLDGINIKPIIFPNIIWMLPIIAFGCYIGFYALLGLMAILLIILIILFN